MQSVLPSTMLPTAHKGISMRANRKRVFVRSVAEAEKVKPAGKSSSNGVAPSSATTANIAHKLKYVVGKPQDPSKKDLYQATAWSVREQLIDAFEKTQEYWRTKDPKFVYYLSAEFLMGRSFTNTVYNLGLEGEYADAVRAYGSSLEALQDEEQNAALGNGGLGRLAACFLDSFATLDLPGWGYGIRYKYGMFKQGLKDGYQTEMPDIWLTNGNPWEIRRPEVTFPVGFGGKTTAKKVDGKTVTTWEPAEEVIAMAYDNPIPGYKTATTTNLRLWDALAKTEFDLAAFNAGDFDNAAKSREAAEAIAAVLYPNDATPAGKELRLKQQYFFVSASIQDVLARFKSVHGTKWDLLPEKATFQMNDTHPTIAVAELMRVLVDVEGLSWEKAWNITSQTLNYTNHTVMPEALEKWPVKVMAKILPRHMEIIEIIDAGWKKFLEAKYAKLEPEELEKKVESLAVIQENPWVKKEMLVNMAYLACVGSSHINGVAAIHTEILKDTVLADLYQVFPDKFQNKTNGVTPRRWIAWCNPELSALITKTLGTDAWINDCSKLKDLIKYAEDPDFQAKWREVKVARKAKLAAVIKKLYGQDVDVNSMFDIQIKRIHEYKRQYLNVLSIIWRYKQLKKMTPAERTEAVKRVVVIGGKAASAYDMAKRIIRLVTAVGEKINNDPDTKEYLRLYFIPDYNVDLAEVIIPAAELSQHISTAGTEASGTSNMKFQFNGCLIIGTLDGANIEIAEESGVENMFVFGHEADEITELRETRKTYKTDERWDAIFEDISNGVFGDKEYFKPLVQSVNDMKVGNDWFLLAPDFAKYLDAQEEVDKVYKDQKEWTRRSIVYTATSGKFSSDRTIAEYAADIWKMKPVKVPDN